MGEGFVVMVQQAHHVILSLSKDQPNGKRGRTLFSLFVGDEAVMKN
jgi:hypothetical protein